jgi:hypothetical protein
LADYARELRKRNVDELVIGLGLSRRKFGTQLDELARLIEA